MNKEMELLNKKIEAQDKIINTQALEIARLKEQNKYIEQWWKETNVIIRNDKSLAINDNAMEYILDLEEEIARLKEQLNCKERLTKIMPPDTEFIILSKSDYERQEKDIEEIALELRDRIYKAIEHCKSNMFVDSQFIYELLEILGDKENE